MKEERKTTIAVDHKDAWSFQRLKRPTTQKKRLQRLTFQVIVQVETFLDSEVLLTIISFRFTTRRSFQGLLSFFLSLLLSFLSFFFFQYIILVLEVLSENSQFNPLERLCDLSKSLTFNYTSSIRAFESRFPASQSNIFPITSLLGFYVLFCFLPRINNTQFATELSGTPWHNFNGPWLLHPIDYGTKPHTRAHTTHTHTPRRRPPQARDLMSATPE